MSTVTFSVPTREQVSPANQAIFDHMLSAFGKVPNLYATFALNETALADYLALQNRQNSLSAKEREIINLVVSQVNDCKYCVATGASLVALPCAVAKLVSADIRRFATGIQGTIASLPTTA